MTKSVAAAASRRMAIDRLIARRNVHIPEKETRRDSGAAELQCTSDVMVRLTAEIYRVEREWLGVVTGCRRCVRGGEMANATIIERLS